MDNLITTKLPCFDETLYTYMFTRYMGPNIHVLALSNPLTTTRPWDDTQVAWGTRGSVLGVPGVSNSPQVAYIFIGPKRGERVHQRKPSNLKVITKRLHTHQSKIEVPKA